MLTQREAVIKPFPPGDLLGYKRMGRLCQHREGLTRGDESEYLHV